MSRKIIIGCSLIAILVIGGLYGLYRFVDSFEMGTHLNEKDEKFFIDMSDKMFELAPYLFEYRSEEGLDGRLLEVRKFEEFVKKNEGHEFESGTVFREGSSLHILTLTSYIRVYDLAGECEKVYELLYEFNEMINKNYLIIDFIVGEAIDPELHSGFYNDRKTDNDNLLTGYLSALDCYECEIQPAPDWHPEEDCGPDNEGEFSID